MDGDVVQIDSFEGGPWNGGPLGTGPPTLDSADHLLPPGSTDGLYVRDRSREGIVFVWEPVGS